MTRKRRVPKPPANTFTQWVLRAIPLLDDVGENWNPEKTLGVVKKVFPDTLRSFSSARWCEEEATGGEALKSLRWVRAFLAGILKRLNEGSRPAKLSAPVGEPNFSAMLEQAHAEINRFFPRKWCLLADSGSGWLGVAGTIGPRHSAPRPFRDECSLLRAYAAFMILESLSTSTGENGRHYFGACPKCGKPFKKMRLDQEYCGKACSSTMRVWRFRGKI